MSGQAKRDPESRENARAKGYQGNRHDGSSLIKVRWANHSVEGPATATKFSVFAVPAASSTRFPNFSISFKYETSVSAPSFVSQERADEILTGHEPFGVKRALLIGLHRLDKTALALPLRIRRKNHDGGAS